MPTVSHIGRRRLERSKFMNYKEYLAYVNEAKSYESAEAIRMEYGYPPECEWTAEGLIKVFEIIFAVSKSDFPKIVELSGGNLSELCRWLNIPLRTAQAWTAGDRTPPTYIIQMIGFALISQCEKEE